MKFASIDLFAGAGGVTCGFGMAGVETLAAYDSWGDACDSLAANIGPERVHKCRIEDIDVKDLLRVVDSADFDYLILHASPPCQKFSLSNKNYHKGTAQTCLDQEPAWVAMLKVIDKVAPDFVTLENVPQFVSSQLFLQVRGFLGKRYSISMDVVPLGGYGVPQTRNRFLAVASSKFAAPIGLPPLVLHEDDYLTLYEAIGDLPPVGSSDDKLHNLTSVVGDEILGFVRQIPPRKSLFDYPELIGDRVRFGDAFRRAGWDTVMSGLTSEFTHPCKWLFHPSEDRGFTIREGARIQSFPDSWQFVSDGLVSLRRQIANAVPPLAAKALAEHIIGSVDVAQVSDSVVE